MIKKLILICAFIVVAVVPALTTGKMLSILDNPFLYSMQETETESGLQYLKARYYHPQIARFISRDSFALDNRYAYADGNPIMKQDPSGHVGIFAALLNFAIISQAPESAPELAQAESALFTKGPTMLNSSEIIASESEDEMSDVSGQTEEFVDGLHTAMNNVLNHLERRVYRSPQDVLAEFNQNMDRQARSLYEVDIHSVRLRERMQLRGNRARTIPRQGFLIRVFDRILQAGNEDYRAVPDFVVMRHDFSRGAFRIERLGPNQSFDEADNLLPESTEFYAYQRNNNMD